MNSWIKTMWKEIQHIVCGQCESFHLPEGLISCYWLSPSPWSFVKLERWIWAMGCLSKSINHSSPVRYWTIQSSFQSTCLFYYGHVESAWLMFLQFSFYTTSTSYFCRRNNVKSYTSNSTGVSTYYV